MIDLPAEVLLKIPADINSVLALAQVNRHLYDVYISDIYHSFLDDPVRDRSGWEHLIPSLWTVFSVPRLASLTKRLSLMAEEWEWDILWYAGLDEKHQAGEPPSHLQVIMEANKPSTDFAAGWILAKLPKLEVLHMELIRDDKMLQIASCTMLKEVNLNGNSHRGTSLATIAALLGLPLLLALSFTVEREPEERDLLAVPSCSSPLQSLTLWDSHDGPGDWHVEPGVPRLTARRPLGTTVRILLDKIKALQSFTWQRSHGSLTFLNSPGTFLFRVPARDPNEDPEMLKQSANLSFPNSLKSLRLVLRHPSAPPPGKTRICGSLCGLDNLEHLELSPDMILNEPYYESDWSRTSHANKEAGYFSAQLPASLQRLDLQANHFRYDRVDTYWLDLIEDVLHDIGRLANLRAINIQGDFYSSNICRLRGSWAIHARCLCEKSKLSVRMKQLCKAAGVELRITRQQMDYNTRQMVQGDVDDPNAYIDKEVHYNTAFDDVNI